VVLPHSTACTGWVHRVPEARQHKGQYHRADTISQAPRNTPLIVVTIHCRCSSTSSNQTTILQLQLNTTHKIMVFYVAHLTAFACWPILPTVPTSSSNLERNVLSRRYVSTITGSCLSFAAYVGL
jgi:hypothetical protein